MKLTVKKPMEMNYIGRQIERDIRNFLTTRLIVALTEFHRALEDTPVYTGRTLANYRWSIGAPIEQRRAAIATPLLPGKTSNLSIGAEPRRAANQALIDAEFKEVIRQISRDRNPYQKIFLTNNLPNFTDVEYGSYRENARTPAGGMVRRGEAKIRLIIKGIEKVG